MKGDKICPRCGGRVRPPGAWSSRWICPAHGEIYPLQPITTPSARLIRHLTMVSPVPLWLPWPLPRGWVITAVLHAGDDVSGVRATGVVVSGPNPLGGPGDLLLAAEEQGIGLGAGFAGTSGTDPGDIVAREPNARVEVGGRLVPMWWVDSPGRAVYAGQWGGHWLWAILRPESAGALLLEDVSLVDARELGSEVDLLPYGTPPLWLTRGYDR